MPSFKDLIIEWIDAVSKVGHEFYGVVQCSVKPFKPFKSLETLKNTSAQIMCNEFFFLLVLDDLWIENYSQ